MRWIDCLTVDGKSMLYDHAFYDPLIQEFFSSLNPFHFRLEEKIYSSANKERRLLTKQVNYTTWPPTLDQGVGVGSRMGHKTEPDKILKNAHLVDGYFLGTTQTISLRVVKGDEIALIDYVACKAISLRWHDIPMRRCCLNLQHVPCVFRFL